MTVGNYDVLIVGSGPSGVQAAVTAVASGLRVALVDIGETDDKFRDLIPDQPFSHLRQCDANQDQYFLGDSDEVLANLSRAGAHLTPPRQYMIRGMDKLLAMESDSFLPLQSTSAGGLGVSWGANVFALEDFEMQRAGLPAAGVRDEYDQLAADVGVSAPSNAFGDFLAPFASRQAPLPLDTNAAAILKRYEKSKAKQEAKGFRLGQSALAMLSKDLGDRRANQLNDMDFYGDAGWSVYRPQYTLMQLQKAENFSYLPGRLAIRFSEADDRVNLQVKNLKTGEEETIEARRLMLAAGAINTGRLVLRSQSQFGNRLPILCNPNHWVAAVNLSMLGKPAVDARHSLAQLTALQTTNGDEMDYVLAQFYSYRSLLFFRMLRTIPLPPRYGVTFLRLLSTALTCVNLHFSDSQAASKYIELKQEGDRETFRANYEHTPAQQKLIHQSERLMLKRLIGIGCVPMGIARPAHGASIHYAGTIPVTQQDQPFGCRTDGRLNHTSHVYIADGSSWKFLPAKGLTFTLMANARRVGREVVRSLHA